MDPIAQIIIAASTVISAIFAGVAALIGALNARDLRIIHRATNSLTDRLVASTADAARAEGKAEGREEKDHEIRAGT